MAYRQDFDLAEAETPVEEAVFENRSDSRPSGKAPARRLPKPGTDRFARESA